MDILNNLKILSLPKWVVILLAFLILFLPMFSGWVFFLGANNFSKTEVTVSALGLLGSSFPILLASIILFFSNSGISSLKDKTDKILDVHIYKALAFVPDNLISINDRKQELASVAHNHVKGVFYSDYKISFTNNITSEEPQKVTMIIRIELNVRRVNFNLYINERTLEKFIKNNGIEELQSDEVLKFLFPHCSATQEVKVGENIIHYQYNPKFLHRIFDDKDYLCIVGSSELSSEMLWNTSDILYFTQDLILMVRAFYQERPELFWE